MTKRRKQHWTYWATLAYAAGITGFAVWRWLSGAPDPNGWLWAALMVPWLALWWYHGLKKSDADVDYEKHRLRDEVRREVERQLAGRKPLARVVDAELEVTTFETIEDVTVPAGTRVTAALEKTEDDT